MRRPGDSWPACIGPECWPQFPADEAAVYPGKAIPYCEPCARLVRYARLAVRRPAEPVEFITLETNLRLAARIARVQNLPEPLT